MNIAIKYTNLDPTPTVENYVNKNFSTLAKFIKVYEEEGSVRLAVEVARDTHHHKGDVFMAEAILTIPKKKFVVREKGSDAMLTLDACKDTLKEALERYREEQKKKIKTVRRAAK